MSRAFRKLRAFKANRYSENYGTGGVGKSKDKHAIIHNHTTIDIYNIFYFTTKNSPNISLCRMIGDIENLGQMA